MALLAAGIQVPDAASVLSWLAFLVVLYPAAQASYYLFFHPLRKYPGPKLAACTRLVDLYWTATGVLHSKIKELHDQYGDVVRLGPNFLVYRTATSRKAINGNRKHGQNPFMKDPEFIFNPPGGPNIFTENDENHSRIRRLLSHGFSDKSLRDQEPLIQYYVDLLLERLHDTTATSGKPAELSRWYNYTTFDISSDLTFGEPFGCLREKRYHPWVAMIFDAAIKTFALGKALLMYPHFAWLIGMLLPRDLYKKRVDLFQISKEKVDRRLETETSRPDFMSYILRHNDERGVTQKELYSNADSIIVAGSETTATLLSGFTFFVLSNATAYKTLVDELRRAFRSQRDITFEALSTLPYLNGALEESLRLYPPVPGVIPRRVLKPGVMIDGDFIPEGTSVATAYYSEFRSASNFSAPDSFLPERWFDTKNPKFASDNRDVVQPFSIGPRNCVGKTLAYAEMRLIAAKLLWAFDLSLEESSSNWIDQQPSYFIWEKPPLMVNLTPVQR